MQRYFFRVGYGVRPAGMNPFPPSTFSTSAVEGNVKLNDRGFLSTMSSGTNTYLYFICFVPFLHPRVFCERLSRGLLSNADVETIIFCLLSAHLLPSPPQLTGKQRTWFPVSLLDQEVHLIFQSRKFRSSNNTLQPIVRVTYWHIFPGLTSEASHTPWWLVRLTSWECDCQDQDSGAVCKQSRDCIQLVMQGYHFVYYMHFNVLANFCYHSLPLVLLLISAFFLLPCVFPSTVVIFFFCIINFSLFTYLVSVHLSCSGFSCLQDCPYLATDWF